MKKTSTALLALSGMTLAQTSLAGIVLGQPLGIELGRPLGIELGGVLPGEIGGAAALTLATLIIGAQVIRRKKQ